MDLSVTVSLKGNGGDQGPQGQNGEDGPRVSAVFGYSPHHIIIHVARAHCIEVISKKHHMIWDGEGMLTHPNPISMLLKLHSLWGMVTSSSLHRWDHGTHGSFRTVCVGTQGLRGNDGQPGGPGIDGEDVS